MKRADLLWLTVVLGCFWAGEVQAGSLDSHVVSFDFQQINEISITGSPNLTISSAIAGQQPSDVTVGTSSYAVTTNGTNKKITAALNSAMPANTILRVSAAAPADSGTSQGYVTLATSAADVVTGISQTADSACAVTYKLSATVAAGVIASDTRTVTFTLSD